MKGIKQLSIGLACAASLAVVGCHGRSAAVGYDAGLTSAATGYEAGFANAATGYDAGFASAATGYEAGLKTANAPGQGMDSGMPPNVTPKATVQAQTGVTTSAWDGGFTQHAVAATVTGRR